MNPFDRPIIILSSPRSGSTLLFETLSNSEKLWTIGGESHAVIEHVQQFSTVFNGYKSNELTENDGDENSISILRQRFQSQLRNRHNQPYSYEHFGAVRFLEKTPKNSLRIRFLQKVFPDAMFIFLIRDPKENISSIIEGWRSGRFVTYPYLPGFNLRWSFLLPPNWDVFNDKTVEEIATYQWEISNKLILRDLSTIPQNQWTIVNYQDFLQNTDKVVGRLCDFMGLEYDDYLKQYCSRNLPYSKYTLSKPDINKWRKNLNSMSPYLHNLTDLVSELNDRSCKFTQYKISNLIDK